MTFPRQKTRAIHEKEVHNLVRSQQKPKDEEKKPANVPAPPVINPIPMLPPLPGMSPIPAAFVPGMPPLPIPPPFIPGVLPPLPIPPPFIPGIVPPFIPSNPYAAPTTVAPTLTTDLFTQAKSLPTTEVPIARPMYASSSSNYSTATTKTVSSSYSSTSFNQPAKTRVSRFDQTAPSGSYKKDLYKQSSSYDRQPELSPPTFKPPTAVPYYPDRESASYPRSSKSSAAPSNPYEFEQQEKLYAYESKAPPSLSPPQSSRRYRPY